MDRQQDTKSKHNKKEDLQILQDQNIESFQWNKIIGTIRDTKTNGEYQFVYIVLTLVFMNNNVKRTPKTNHIQIMRAC